MKEFGFLCLLLFSPVSFATESSIEKLIESYSLELKDARIGSRSYPVSSCAALDSVHYVGLSFDLLSQEESLTRQRVLHIAFQTGSPEKQKQIESELREKLPTLGLPQCLKADQFYFMNNGPSGEEPTYQPSMVETEIRCGKYRIWLPLTSCVNLDSMYRSE